MSSKINATDSAIELAKKLEVDIGKITGTGANGRILKSDVEEFHATAFADSAKEALAELLAPDARAQAPVRTQTSTISPSAPVWVKLVGADRAILDGTYLLRNETRRVPFHTYQQAKNGRPNDFAIKYDGSNEYVVETAVLPSADEEE